jgi:hypothetical protein
LAFLLVSARVPAELRPGPIGAYVSAGLSISLMTASVAALMRIQRARMAMLCIAIVYFGTIAVQNLAILAESSASAYASMGPKFVANVGRSSIEIVINAWALCSAKTIAFFSARRNEC